MSAPENGIFLDIETTGLSRKNCHAYLIGTLRKSDAGYLMRIFLAAGPSEEKDLLLAATEYMGDFSPIVTFNGERFDLPFLKARCDLYGIDFSPEKTFDLLTVLSPIKSLLPLNDLRLSTLEEFLGISRTDSTSGKELIDVYNNYSKECRPELEDRLILHNSEDLLGLPGILPLLYYPRLFAYPPQEVRADIKTYMNYNGQPKKELLLSFPVSYALPRPCLMHTGPLFLHAWNQNAVLRIPVFQGEMKHFFPNYKDYYYLPNEDRAVHKSVGAFVDSGRRERATAQNCYTKIQGDFIPQPGELFTPVFFKEYNARNRYLRLTDERLEDKSFLSSYTFSWLQAMKS
ncbi:MAG: ribonuclease H-like domain-containing protein [Lachnospiraceae bacterium]|nr:ribonuclease H-like domain-containing protein [Lachnospiraceae bacterium]